MQPARRTHTRDRRRGHDMNRTEFIIATAIILFVAFGLGWFASWLLHRLTRVTQAEMGELDQMAQALHEAEETRDQALAYLEQREQELVSQLNQTEAELRAAMEGLRDARQEAEELRSYIERVNRG
ncbi:cytochrome PufQ [Frigidibacter albus]|nr:cytochrome PufQ [Frigidibacter albus]